MQDVNKAPVVFATDSDRRRELSAMDPTGNSVGADTEMFLDLFTIYSCAGVVIGWQHTYLSLKEAYSGWL